jgi:uncharacterized protein (TIGR02646 family)
MIKVKRKDCPEILKRNLSPISDGEFETQDALNFYSIPANLNQAYQRTGISGRRTAQSFIVYKDETVREKLKQIFHGKCAYCESKITSIYNGDIEHFRPKGGYCNDNNQPLNKPGYFWLASEWENLLFACPFCNQTNTHKIFTTEDGKVEIREVVLGKLNQFPLKTETHRLKPSDGFNYLLNRAQYDNSFILEDSERLLLKPCSDEVENYFKYSDDGIISERDGLNSLNKKQVETSIRVYALQRISLVQARKEKIIQIKAQIRRVEQAIKNFNNYSEKTIEEKTWFEGIMREEMEILKRFKDDDQEYAGLARYIIDNYFDDFLSL